MWDHLRKLGFNVFPLQPNSKIPSGEWRGFQDMRNNEPIPDGCNAAVVMGQISGNLFVVDLDDKSLLDLFQKYRDKTMVVETGKGFHFYFRWLGDMTVPIARLTDEQGRHIDIQGRGAYVVAPGSTHPDGSRYELVEDREPMWIEPSEIRQIIRDNGFKGPQRGKKAAREGAKKGGRNDNMFQYCRYLISEYGLSEEAILHEALKMNRKNEPPLNESEVRLCATQAENYSTRPVIEDTLEAATGLQDAIDAEIAADPAVVDIMKFSKHMNVYPISVIRHMILDRSPETRIEISRQKKMHDVPAAGFGVPYSFNGMIIAASTDRETYVYDGFFRCPECGAEGQAKCDRFYMIKAPRCPEDKKPMVVVPEKSEYRFIQRVIVQELIEDSRLGTPIEYEFDILDSDVGRIRIGDRKKFIARFRSLESKKPYKDIVFEVLGMEDYGPPVDSIPDADELARLGEGAVFDRVMKSMFPDLVFHDEVIESFMIMMAGGDHKGVKFRPTIHICVMGDAGTGKSTAMGRIEDILPGSTFADAAGASEVGLGIGMGRLRDGTMVPRAGLLPMHSGSIVALDEFDKMDAGNRKAMYTCMEKGIVNLNKIGYSDTKVPARTGIIVGGNPKYDKYDKNRSIADNFGMSAPFLSRFDITLLLTDDHDEYMDRKKIELRRSDEKPPMSTGELQRYFTYVRTRRPEIPKQLNRRIDAKYIEMRKLARGTDLIVTERQHDALYRMVAASAKLNLREVADDSDVDRVERIIDFAHATLRLEKTGIKPAEMKEEEVVFETCKELVEADGRINRGDLVARLGENMKLTVFDAEDVVVKNIKSGRLEDDGDYVRLRKK